MTPGLAFFYGGLVRKKNMLTIMMQSFIAMGVVALIWFVCGFSLAFGADVKGVIGNFQYAFLNGVGMEPNAAYAGTIPFAVFFLFQLMFAIITPALITGAFADRMTFKGYLIFLSLVTAHVGHGFWSAFQTMGWVRKNTRTFMLWLSGIVAGVIFVMFMLPPLFIATGVIH